MLSLTLPLLLAVVHGPVDSHAPTDTAAVYNLDATVISARIADLSTTSVRVTDINSDKIRTKATGHSYPELMREIPGVYASPETGSFGDAKINIRGFKQENISVLLNGIPISGLTSGNMYWNNWMGLADATGSIQLQKGIGNSMVSDNSVGGTINIITTQPSSEPYAQAGISHTGYGTTSIFVAVNSGDLGRGWAFNLMGSHNMGSSYADCTELSTWSYALTVIKNFRHAHSLALTALGSPEQHSQRSQRLSLAEVETYGRSYSKNWGWQTLEDGTRVSRTLSRNNYFKPYFTLQHSYDGDRDGREGLRLVNSIYLAIASGGGFYTESTGKRIASFLAPEGSADAGQIDWDAAIAFNRNVTPDSDGRRAVNIMTDYLAGHTQFGAKSDVVKEFGDAFTIDAGFHYQLYDTWEREQITDLLGADYWYEDYAKKALCGLNGRNPIKKVGDYVRTDNGRTQHYGTIYLLGTYRAGAKRSTVMTLGLSASATGIRRWDNYNYLPEDRFSGWASSCGYSVKAGILHPLGGRLKLYANAAYYNRAPYASTFFSGGSNEISKDVVNEKNMLGEIGFRHVGARHGLEVTAYYAYWKDRTLTSPSFKTVDVDPYKYMIRGLDALHTGVEAEFFWKPWNCVRMDAFASLGDWRWKNDVNATLYDPETLRPMGEVNVYADGLHVGDAPQTQLGLSAELELPKGFRLRASWNYNDRLWADFDPVTRTAADDRSDSCRLPSWHMLNAGLQWEGAFRGNSLVLFLNVDNITDSFYVERSKDGSGHDVATLTGYWGNGRSVNFGLRLSLGR